MTSAWSTLRSNLAGGSTSLLRRPHDLLRHRSARFALVGIAATVMHGGTLGLLSGPARLPALSANTLALLASALFSYLGHRSFTFRSTVTHAKSLVKFLGQLAGSWIVTSAIAVALIPVLGPWPVSALIVVLVPCLNYLVYARWTFR